MAKAPIMSDTNAKEHCKVADGLFSKAQGWMSLAQEVCDNFYPERADYTAALNMGDDFAGDLMDSYPVMARAQLGDAIESMLRQGQWFEVGTGDEDRDKKGPNARGLQRLTMQLRSTVIDHRSQFQVATKECDHDWVTVGNPVMTVEMSQNRTHLIYKAHHPRDVVWMQNADRVRDTYYRKLTHSARTLVSLVDSGAWEGTLHPDIRSMAKKDPEHQVNLYHCLSPMDNTYGSDAKRKRDLGGKKYLSAYYDADHQMTLRERGAPVMNYLAPRYRTLAQSPRGFSPVATQTLPNGRMAQSLAGLVLEQAEKAIDPPMIGAGEVFTRDINLYSGGFTYVDLAAGQSLGDAMTVVDTAKNMPLGLEMMRDLRAMIAEGFLLNKLMLPNTREMTAYEASVRTDEFRRAALPFFNPIDAEYHSPLLAITLEMMLANRLIDIAEIPRELMGQEISFRFQSPLKEADGQKRVQAYQQSMQLIAAATQVDQQIARIFEVREATMDAVRGTGAPATWIKDEKEREAIDAEDTQVDDAMRTAAALKEGASVVADLSAGKVAAEQSGLAA